MCRMKFLSTCVFLLCLWFGMQTEGFADPKRGTQANAKETITYVVQKGDSLDKIGRKYHVSANDIVQWNKLPDASHIRIGQKLKLRVPRGTAEGSSGSGKDGKSSGNAGKSSGSADGGPYTYVVKKGDSLGRISKKTGISIETLKKNNPELKKHPNQLRVGQKIVLRVRRFDGATGQSIGFPNNGILMGGIELKAGKGYSIQRTKRAFGTALTVGTLMDAFEDFGLKYPSDPGFVVGDLSAQGGGRLPPHLSHQSGRDVDISYITKGAAKAFFQRMNASNFDAERNWHFIEFLLKSGKVQYIFVDHDLQKLLYAQAKKRGYSDSQLESLMQYPRSINNRTGIIRHAKGHADHMHVRFLCPPADKDCH